MGNLALIFLTMGIVCSEKSDGTMPCLMSVSCNPEFRERGISYFNEGTQVLREIPVNVLQGKP